MRVVSVNVGLPRSVPHSGKPVLTGIFKEAVGGRVLVRRLGLEGDGQADLRVHGGESKAVYLYPLEHYAHWAAELERDDFVPGQFGENLTTEGLREEDTCVGDRLRVGEALLEVTQPRVPCFKLGLRMNDAQFPKRFLASLRSGFYARVIGEGTVAAGDVIELVPGPSPRTAISKLVRVAFFAPEDKDTIRQALAAPALSPSWREDLEELLGR